MSRAVVTEEARADMAETYQWYADKDADLAMQFMLCVRETVDMIEKSPLRFPVTLAGIRKAHVKKFPFAVWYVTDGDSVVIACLHSRRDGRSIVIERVRALGPAPE